MTDYKQIVASLSSLSRGELEQLRQRIGFYLQHPAVPAPAPVEEEDWLLVGIFTELQRRGVEGPRAFRIRRTTSYAGFETQSVRVRSLLLQAAPGLTAVERRALGEVAADALARRLDGWRDVNRDNMLMNVSKVPEAVERCYPGYLGAGLLAAVVRHRL